jgi:Txe/YoeB family toxin of Txe-Axe toxin-antitoxin module
VEEVKSEIIFADEKIQIALEKLKTSKTEDKKLYEFLIRAFEDLEKDAFCGIQIPKKLIPKEYHKKYGQLDNLWKYNLPSAWRLMYTIKNGEVMVLSIILEWMTHKEYEKKFNY